MPDNSQMHIPELGTMAFIKDNDNRLVIHGMGFILLDEGRKLLNGRDDDMRLGILELALEDRRGRVAVGRAFFEAVILLHGLVVQILAVHDEEDLVHKGQRGRDACGLEGGQGFAGAGGMPDVAAGGDGAILLVVMGDLDAVDDALCGGDLIGPHDEKHVLGSENAVLRENVQEGMTGKEGAGEILQIRDDAIVRICPERSELKAVTGFFLFRCPGLMILDGVETGTVGIILGVDAIGDNKDLDILEETATGPEGIPLITIDLIEGFAEGNAPALELNMHKGQAVDEDRNIVAIIMAGTLGLADLILIDDLQDIVMDILLIDEENVLGHAVVPLQRLDIILLDFGSLLHDMVIRIGEGLGEKPLPFTVGKMIIIQFFQLRAKIGNEIRLRMNGQMGIALLTEHADQLLFQSVLRLVGVIGAGRRLIHGNDRVFTGLRYDAEIGHDFPPVYLRSKDRSLSR